MNGGRLPPWHIQREAWISKRIAASGRHSVNRMNSLWLLTPGIGERGPSVHDPTDAVVDKGAVVVELGDAAVADGAVFRAQRLADLPRRDGGRDTTHTHQAGVAEGVLVQRAILRDSATHTDCSVDTPPPSSQWSRCAMRR